jgi:copper transport protein
MILTLPELPPGLYSVRWKVLSEADGHFTHGPLVFGIGEGLDLSNMTVPETIVAVPLPEVGLRWLNYSLLLTLAGSIVVTYLVLAPIVPGLEAEDYITLVRGAAQRRTLALAMACSGLALAVGLGLLAWQTVALLGTLPDEASAQDASWQILTRTRWGLLWWVRQGTLLLLSGAIFWLYRAAKDRSAPYPHQATRVNSSFLQDRFLIPLLPLVGLLLLALLLTQSLTSHAAAITPNTALAIAIDALHLLAASLWVGGLMALSVGLLPLIPRKRADFVVLARAGWRPFSRIAALSVMLLIATGLYSAGRHVASIDAFLTTLYGQALLGKVSLMLIVGVFGLLNSMALHPGLAAPLARLFHRPPGWTPLSLHRLPVMILIEASLGLLILLATGLATAAPTARGPEFEVASDEAPSRDGVPTALSQSVDDMVITFSAKPNRPGQNLFTLRVASTRRPPPAEIIRVLLRFTFLGQEMGRTSVDMVEVEPGLYQIGGNQLSLAGPWRVQAVVRRGGIEDTIANFDWTVAPIGAMQPVIISRRALEPLLTRAAAIIILVTLLAVGGIGLGRDRLAKLFFFKYKFGQLKRSFQKALEEETAVSITLLGPDEQDISRS